MDIRNWTRPSGRDGKVYPSDANTYCTSFFGMSVVPNVLETVERAPWDFDRKHLPICLGLFWCAITTPCVLSLVENFIPILSSGSCNRDGRIFRSVYT